MKTAVFVPSHINYSDQLMRLETCLDSLINQTVKTDIFVSISFDNDEYKRNFTPILRKYSSIKFVLSAKQKFQMEHLFTLSRFSENYDIIMFCDDDDTYNQFRVEQIIESFKHGIQHSNTSGFSGKFGGVRELKDIDDIIPEYWAYGICPWLLVKFFTIIKGYENLLCHKFADMYFRNFLRVYDGKALMFVAIVPQNGILLYNYTQDNPNSICMRLTFDSTKLTAEIAIPRIKDNLTLGLICNNNKMI